MSSEELDQYWVRVKDDACFPVNGQGTFILTSSSYVSYKILVWTPKEEKNKRESKDINRAPIILPETYMGLELESDMVQFVSKEKGEAKKVLQNSMTGSDEKGDDDKETIGTQLDYTVSYWFSYDRDLMVLKYGKGYRMNETTILQHDIASDGKNKKEEEEMRKIFFSATTRKMVSVYGRIPIMGTTIIDVVPVFQFRPNPLVNNCPPLVKDSSTVTLFDLDQGRYMFSSSMPSACKELYDNIKNLSLNYPEDQIMKLSDAIRHSIETPGKILYDKLKEKGVEFGYLRVTLGPDSRIGPGIPYVLEIWPSRHFSPIHNHGNACAIIKVLFGRININIYNQQMSPVNHGDPSKEPVAPLPKKIKVFEAKEGDITWISPDWYQTHKLTNDTDDFCATIQCYRYDNDDMIHWPGFDYYADDKHHLDVFYPDSDFTFVEMRRKVMEEYKDYLENYPPM